MRSIEETTERLASGLFVPKGVSPKTKPDPIRPNRWERRAMLQEMARVRRRAARKARHHVEVEPTAAAA